MKRFPHEPIVHFDDHNTLGCSDGIPLRAVFEMFPDIQEWPARTTIYHVPRTLDKNNINEMRKLGAMIQYLVEEERFESIDILLLAIEWNMISPTFDEHAVGEFLDDYCCGTTHTYAQAVTFLDGISHPSNPVVKKIWNNHLEEYVDWKAFAEEHYGDEYTFIERYTGDYDEHNMPVCDIFIFQKIE